MSAAINKIVRVYNARTGMALSTHQVHRAIIEEVDCPVYLQSGNPCGSLAGDFLPGEYSLADVEVGYYAPPQWGEQYESRPELVVFMRDKTFAAVAP